MLLIDESAKEIWVLLNDSVSDFEKSSNNNNNNNNNSKKIIFK